MTFEERIDALTARHEALTARHEALTVRHEALTMNLELISHDLETLRANSERDAENIRALARIAELHERRLTHLEGEPQSSQSERARQELGECR